METEAEIKEKISKNREQIERLLNNDFPLNFIYAKIRALSKENERLIEQIGKHITF